MRISHARDSGRANFLVACESPWCEHAELGHCEHVCTVQGREGLILVEAKAYDHESKKEGKNKGDPENHEQIGIAIRGVNGGLNRICPGWALTRDSHYQLSNRIAWTWRSRASAFPLFLFTWDFCMLRR
jgi:hypothetical protein